MRPALGVLLLCACTAPAAAQTNDHFFRSWAWSADPSSARTAGLGGAAVALPDDVGAAQVNPANLTSLGKTEVTASLRHTSDGALVPSRDIGAVPDALTAHTGLGMVAGAGRIGTRFAVAASLAGTRELHLVMEPRPLPDGLTDEGNLEARVTSGGVAGAWQIGRALHVGARIDASRASLSGEYRREAPSRAAELRVGTGGAATRVMGTLGALWEATPAVRLGVVAASGASYPLERTAVSPALGVTFDPGSTFHLRQPATLSLGACLKLSRQVSAVGQVDRVRYGEIQDNLSIRVGAHARSDYALSDAWEPRAGVEVSLPLQSASVQLRGGYHRAASGALLYVAGDPVEAASFLGSASEDVWSAGASVATRGFRLDVAGVWRHAGDQVLVGVTGRF